MCVRVFTVQDYETYLEQILTVEVLDVPRKPLLIVVV